MTTFDVAVATFKGARAASKQARAERRARTIRTARTGAVAFRRVVLQAGGLASLTFAAWTIAMPLGFLAAGISAFVLSWLLDG